MDRLAALPFEIRKKILNSFDDRRDVFHICSLSAEMLRAAQPLRKQYLEAELGADVVTAVFPDALAVITSPRIDRAVPDMTQRELMSRHLMKWRNKDHADICTEALKLAAACFIDKTVVPFVEDFAAKAQKLRSKDKELRFPSWVNEDRRKDAYVSVDSVRVYRPEERVRLIRAFCRFQMLSKVIQARPGPQLWSMREQDELLRTFFDAWEVEEVLCVQQYVGDLHTLLWIKHLDYIAAEVARAINDSKSEPTMDVRTLEDQVWEDERCFTLRYDPARPHMTGHVGSLFFMDKRGIPNIPVRNLEFVDIWTQSTFLKHLATFGLDFLHAMLMKDEGSYKRWIRVYGDAMLDKIAHRDQAAHFGSDADWIWIGDVEDFISEVINSINNTNNNNDSDDGDEEDEEDDPPTNLGRNPGVRESEANLGWKLLKKASQTSRDGFRRCGWVFWDEERLRKLKFWNTERDVDAESLPEDLAWAAEPKASDKAAYSLRGLSPAERKLYRFARERSEMVIIIGADAFGEEFDEDDDEEVEYHPLSFIHGSQMVLFAWAMVTGLPEPVAVSEPIWLFQGILWG